MTWAGGSALHLHPRHRRPAYASVSAASDRGLHPEWVRDGDRDRLDLILSDHFTHGAFGDRLDGSIN
jgi:hypothetical protein